MKIKTEVLYLPRPSSHYPGSMPLHFEKLLPDILRTKSFVHLFSGMSKIGHTVDINPLCKPKSLANAEELPFPSNYFEGGFADPPYNKEFAEKLYDCSYPKWSKWTKELVRCVKPTGRIAIMQNYIVPRLNGCKIVEIIIVLGRIKQYPKIVTVQIKEKDSQKTIVEYS